MSYYKLISDNVFIGVAMQNDFRVFQHKHRVLLSCDEESAQYVQCGEYLYRDGWMVPVTTDRVEYKTAEVIQIKKDEYDILRKSIENGEDIKVELEEPVFKPDEPIIDKNDVVTIDYVKSTKIAEMNYVCNKVIENGVDVLLSDGNLYHFSLTTQDQLNLITLQSMIASGEISIPYHADGELCRYYSVDDILLITDAATAHKTFHVTYFNSLKVYINALEDISDIAEIQYGMDIPYEYQSDILKGMYLSMEGKQ